jgi:hypothetical protein
MVAFVDEGRHGPVISLWRSSMPKEVENLGKHPSVKQEAFEHKGCFAKELENSQIIKVIEHT